MSKAVAVDCGTMFFQTAEQGTGDTVYHKIIRNAFVEMAATEEGEDTFKKNGWDYVKDGDKFYVIGDDALKVARLFPGKVELRRPLQDGVMNKGEEKKLIVLDKMILSTIGKAPDDKSVVTTCVSSPSVDGSQDSDFHKKRLEALFKSKGWQVRFIEEAFAIILSEKPSVTETDGSESTYSGIALSFGAGRCNCVLAYKKYPVVGLSAARSGDWVDKMVARDTVGEANISQVINYKETKLDFDNLDMDSDIAVALDAYYESMIKYVFTLFAKKFQEVKSQFDQPLPIVVAGGTSMPKGFINKLQTVVSSLQLPFKVKEVKHAKNPRNAVVEGCLLHAIASQKKLEKDKIAEMLDKE